MADVTLPIVAVLLAALAIAAPLARWLGIGSVLGYLIAGVLLGPYGLTSLFSIHEAKELLHVAEFGIILLLFLIGLELRPRRLWAMRNAIFGLGGAQVGISALLLGAAAVLFGLPWHTALFAGLALALSSTAFALQVLEENGELSARHGRLAFAVLLFQDLAAIPLIALAPLFAVGVATAGMDFKAAIIALATIAAVVVAGYFLLDHAIRLIARTRVKEAMTAVALLTVVGVALIMQSVGVSASLGAFIAGALLAESSYRHELEADLAPFQGLLLGLFFTAVGMSLNLRLIIDQPLLVATLVVGLVAIKSIVLFQVGRAHGLERRPARRLGMSLSQGGEFAFVLFATGVTAGVMARGTSDLLSVVVTLTMAATPLLLAIDSWMDGRKPSPAPLYDALPDNDRHVVIAGFGRYGQIVARILRGKKIPFTALDISPEQVELVKQFGAQAFYGDASRPEILEAAQIGKARALVLAIDDVEASMRTAELVRAQFPDLPVFARARHRNHAHRLLDLGITTLQRETFHSALETTRQVLKGLGYSDRETERVIKTFRTHDERRLSEDYKHYSDMEKLQSRARSDAATLERLFAEDAEEEAKIATQATKDGVKPKEPPKLKAAAE
ncbi:MAG: monovalent cation:proton antiporter-2 (CPA2) family protein [Hyphomicrobiaceae bacterium]|nr:monovalent cation:proton antiporter-2 (CPA2) family protein [Hyphomicrobiaceae bacterium]